jgi:hypothetical protein
MKERGYKRRRLLIDGSQRQLLAVYFIHFTIILVVFFAALAFVFNQQVLRSELTVDQKHEMASMIMAFSHRLWPALWILFFFLVAHSIYVSHKIAGPLYRIRCVLTSVGSGNLKARARIRRGDYLKEDAEAVNTMVRELDKRIGRMRGDCGVAREELVGLCEAIEKGSRRDAMQRAEGLMTRLAGWEQNLEAFDTSMQKKPVVRDDTVTNDVESEEEPILAN